ncbi:MAG: translation initiation factor [Planctomycetota bacterium]
MGLFDGTALERPVTCERCGKVMADCPCPRDAAGEVKTPKDQQARVLREKRRGKWTTVVTGLDPVATDLPGLLKTFKTQLGTGGTTRPDGFELQGDVRDKLVETLKAAGYPAKPAGG